MTVDSQHRKFILKQTADWVSSVATIDVIIQQGEKRAAAPDPPYLALSTVAMGVPVSTPERRYEKKNGTLKEIIKQHFRAEIQIDAIGEGAERWLFILGMTTNQDGGQQVSVSPQSVGDISDATQVFEGFQEHRSTRDIEIRYSLEYSRDSGTDELEILDADLLDENDNVDFDASIDIT